MGVENIRKATKLQALHMAEFAGIKLTRRQVDTYIEYRQGIFNRSLLEDTLVSSYFSDQKLLDLMLNPDQRVVFESHYPNIFPPSDNSEK